MTLYADETSISYSSSSLADINQTLNSELNNLKQWLQGNKYSLNVLKTKALILGPQPKIKKIIDKTVDHPQSFIGDSKVENVDRTKYLDVIIDRSLNWEEHVNSLCRAMPLIRSLGWSTIDDIIRGETATAMYKSLNGLVPEYLSYLFEKTSTRNVRKLRNTETDLSPPIRKTLNSTLNFFSWT